MAAEFDTEPNYSDEEQTPQPASATTRDDRGLWAMLALLVFAAVILLLLLTQCTARVPNTVGLSLSDARVKLARAGLPIGDISESAAGTGRPGYVNEQAPFPGAVVRDGTSVDLVVAAGADLVTVPDVCGHDAANASVKLIQAGFEVASAEEYSDRTPVGVAIWQSPEAGTKAHDGSTVTVYYSLGPQSAAKVAVSRSPAGDGMTDADRGTTGSGTGPLMMNCVRAYPGATAWSSGGNIYVRLTPGGAARRVTSTSAWDTAPVISPSHKYLVFLRAPSSGAKATSVGAVCFTTFGTYMLDLPISQDGSDNTRYYTRPVFAPSKNSTRADTDWIVVPQYWYEVRGAGNALSARLLICNVPLDSTWVSWNIRFRPASSLSVGPSSRAGCVLVTQTRGSSTTRINFNPSTGLYPH